MKNYTVTLNLGRKDYRQAPTIERLQRPAYTYKCKTEKDGTFISDGLFYNASNINYQLRLVKNPSYSNMQPLTEFASAYLFSVAHICAVVALKSIYTNACNPHIYALYCEACKIAKNMNVNFSLETVMEKHTRKRGKLGKMEECIPYYTQKVITELEDVSDVPDDMNAQDIIDHIQLVLLALVRSGHVTCYTDVWTNVGVIWASVNKYVTEERRIETQVRAMDENRDVLENIGIKDKTDSVKLWKETVAPQLEKILCNQSKHIDSEKAHYIVRMYSYHMDGYTQEEIAKKMDVSRDTVKRQLSLFKKYIETSVEALETVKEAIAN